NNIKLRILIKNTTKKYKNNLKKHLTKGVMCAAAFLIILIRKAALVVRNISISTTGGSYEYHTIYY
ncbi:MAG: hypothetical protein ACI4DK_08770, partial [Lachnospiraceae bacterium]